MLSNWCNDCFVYANQKIVKCVTSVCLCIHAMMSEFDFFGNISKMAKIFEIFYVCPFFWFSSSIRSPHEAANGSALLCQTNTKCDITSSALSAITEQQINDWKKLMSLPHQIVFSLATVLQWMFVRIMKNLSNRRIAIFFFLLFLSFTPQAPLTHSANSGLSLLAMVNNIIKGKKKIYMRN